MFVVFAYTANIYTHTFNMHACCRNLHAWYSANINFAKIFLTVILWKFYTIEWIYLLYTLYINLLAHVACNSNKIQILKLIVLLITRGFGLTFWVTVCFGFDISQSVIIAIAIDAYTWPIYWWHYWTWMQ